MKLLVILQNVLIKIQNIVHRASKHMLYNVLVLESQPFHFTWYCDLCDAALRDALRDDLLGLVDVLAGGLVERQLRRALLLALPLSRQRLRRGSSLL